MRRLLAVVSAALLLAVSPPSNQAIDFSTLDANQGGATPNFNWVGASPAPSNQIIDYSHYKTYVQNKTTGCTVPGLASTYVMTWGDVISCATTHTASQQTETVAGNYHTVTYSATSRIVGGDVVWTCNGPIGSDGYTGVPITLPAGTVAPGSSTPLALSLSGVSFPGTSSSLTVQLKNPSGSVVQTWPGITTNWSSGNYTTAGAAGAWSWTITQVGGSDGACDSVNGVTNFGGTQASWSATATWFQ